MSEIKLNTTGGSGGSVSLKGPASTTGNADVDFVLPQADGSAGQFLKTDGSAQLSWDSAGGLDGVTTGSGNVTITDGNLIVASGHGIDFSATADADSGGETISNVNEVFDDYEEGRWTPTLMYSGAANCTTNAYSPKGRYVKCGQLVFISGYIALTATGSNNGGGWLEIHGIPFASDQYAQPDRPAYSGVCSYWDNWSSVKNLGIILGNNNDYANITGGDGSSGQLQYGSLTDTSWLAFSVTFRSNA